MKTNVNVYDRRYCKTHSLIKETAVFIAEKTGWKRVTVTELTKIADINRNTFYLHFETMEDVFDGIENNFVQKYENILTKCPLYEMLTDKTFFDDFCSFLENEKDYVSTIKKIGREDYLLMKLQKVWTSFFESALSKFYPDIKEKTIVIHYLSGSMFTFFSSWINDTENFDSKKNSFFNAEVINHLIEFASK